MEIKDLVIGEVYGVNDGDDGDDWVQLQVVEIHGLDILMRDNKGTYIVPFSPSRFRPSINTIKYNASIASIEENLGTLVAISGEQHDVRFIPSALLGGGFNYRVTVTNLPRMKFKAEYSAVSGSYRESLDIVACEIRLVAWHV